MGDNNKQSQVKARRKLINPVFHLQGKKEDDGQLTAGMIKVVRKTGQLNLSGRALATVPSGVFTMYDIGADSVANFDMSKCTEDPWWTFQPLNYLDLSSNTLTEIPSGVGVFQDLSVLNCQDNNLTTLPPQLGLLQKLTKLNLCRNKINKLPVEFSQLGALKQLNLSSNRLETLDDSFVDLVMLETLDLSHNQLTNLPTGMGFLVRLTDINLAHNRLTELPPDITHLRALQKLDVTHNNLQTLPHMGGLRKLQVLYAQHNDIVDLPLFEGCSNLQELHFGNNFIKKVSSEFCEDLSMVKILDLKDNKIESLPMEIGMLQHLIRLDLTNNELIGLPYTLGLLSNLQNFQVEGNKFKQIRQDVIKAGTCRLLKHLRDKMEEELPRGPRPTTVLCTPELRVFPDKYMMRNTRALNVSKKDIAVVPDKVFRDALAAEVGIIDLSRNKFIEVPKGIQIAAENISELNFSMNKIKTLPDFIGDFSRLQYLDLGNNSLTALPTTLSKLMHLRELSLSFNLFTSLPECVYKLQSLEILLVSDNQITIIDAAGLKGLKRLATLDFTNNNIENVPFELGNVKQLRCLELKGNLFRLPRYSILDQGTDAILSYLRDRIPS